MLKLMEMEKLPESSLYQRQMLETEESRKSSCKNMKKTRKHNEGDKPYTQIYRRNFMNGSLSKDLVDTSSHHSTLDSKPNSFAKIQPSKRLMDGHKSLWEGMNFQYAREQR